MKTRPHNKELKLTKPCAIGASQLNSSVRLTNRTAHGRLARPADGAFTDWMREGE